MMILQVLKTLEHCMSESLDCGKCTLNDMGAPHCVQFLLYACHTTIKELLADNDRLTENNAVLRDRIKAKENKIRMDELEVIKSLIEERAEELHEG